MRELSRPLPDLDDRDRRRYNYASAIRQPQRTLWTAEPIWPRVACWVALAIAAGYFVVRIVLGLFFGMHA